MHITLIGMSNIGKSHWARKLAGKGYELIACDALIEQKLAPELAGHAGIGGVAAWMGQPFDPQYPRTSAQYLTAENTVMREAVARLQSSPASPCVVDTTGSVIYMDRAITDALRALTRIVYFEASPAHETQLFECYRSDPKPVIWGDAYAPKPGEAPEDALKRCYPHLLRRRAALYAAMAQATIPYEAHRAGDSDLMALFGAA